MPPSSNGKLQSNMRWTRLVKAKVPSATCPYTLHTTPVSPRKKSSISAARMQMKAEEMANLHSLTDVPGALATSLHR
jgi:hypothetical protein